MNDVIIWYKHVSKLITKENQMHMGTIFSWTTLIFPFMMFSLIILFVVSFALFIRRILVNAAERNRQLQQINRHLEQVVERMDQDRHDK